MGSNQFVVNVGVRVTLGAQTYRRKAYSGAATRHSRVRDQAASRDPWLQTLPRQPERDDVVAFAECAARPPVARKNASRVDPMVLIAKLNLHLPETRLQEAHILLVAERFTKA